MDFIQEYEENKNQRSRVDDNLGDSSVLLSMVGGVGDAIMAIGGSGRSLSGRKNTPKRVAAVVKENQMELILGFEGIDEVHPPNALKNPAFCSEFDYKIDFADVFTEGMFLRSGGYYRHIANKLGAPVFKGKLTLPENPFRGRKNIVTIHPGASNPNRRWLFERWGKVALALRDAGYDVFWLGCKQEYGFNDDHIFKVSDVTQSLLEQALYVEASTLFLGNDSGFCHLAGVLDIPGYVLFSSTLPEDVIGNYHSLKGLHAFSIVGNPTRSLDINDKKSYEAIDAITVEKVLDELGLDASSSTPPQPNKDIKLFLHPDDRLKALSSSLAEDYVIMDFYTDGVAKLFYQDDALFLDLGNQKFRVSDANSEILKRGIMESMALNELHVFNPR